jgi:hypothetical protein
MYFVRLTGRKSEALEDLVEQALVVKLKNGKVYGGRLDEYSDGTIALYSCKLLEQTGHRWVDHDIMVRSEGKLMTVDRPEFCLSEVKEILVLPEDQRDKLELDDILQTYIDRHYKPPRGIECDWDLGEDWEDKRHSPECDGRLHEALTLLKTATHGARLSSSMDKNQVLMRRLEEGFAYLRLRLLMYGARIP